MNIPSASKIPTLGIVREFSDETAVLVLLNLNLSLFI